MDEPENTYEAPLDGGDAPSAALVVAVIVAWLAIIGVASLVTWWRHL